MVDNNDENVIYFYEIYRDETAFQEHLQAPRFIAYRDVIQGMVESQATRAITFLP